MKVLLDTSVLLDLLLNRSPWAADMAALWDAHRRGQIEAFLAAFAVPTVFYIIRRQTPR
jgi:predicted nucleic acid-binding protein